jgi:hypothetical protein
LRANEFPRRTRCDRIAMLRLAFGLSFADLYSDDGAARIDCCFVDHLDAADAALAARLRAARLAPEALSRKDEATLLIEVAPHVEDFVARLFGVGPDVRALQARHHALAPLFAVRRQFVQRKAMNAHPADVAATFDGGRLRAELVALVGGADGVKPFEAAFAAAVTRWQEDEGAHAAALDLAQRYAAWAAHTPAGKAAHRGGVLFRAPRKLDPLKLVPVEAVDRNGVSALRLESTHPLRRRDGFALTDRGTDFRASLNGFGNVVVHARCQAGFTVALHRICSHRNDPWAVAYRNDIAQLAGSLVAIHFRHLHIEENYIKGSPLHGCQDLQTVGGALRTIAQLAQQKDRHPLINDIVLRQEDAQRKALRKFGLARHGGDLTVSH